MKKIAILGSTGSIGTQTLDVAAANPERIRVVALAAHKNDVLLEAQIRKFQPLVAALSDPASGQKAEGTVQRTYGDLQRSPRSWPQPPAAKRIRCWVPWWAMRGFVPPWRPSGREAHCPGQQGDPGSGGQPGDGRGEKAGVRLTPVDSEHSAIFQCLQATPTKT